MLSNTSRIGRIGMTAALAVVMVTGTGGAVASASSGTPPAAAPASGVTPAVTCTTSAPPSGWTFDSIHYFPDECRKCLEAGRQLEASGRWRAYCHWRPGYPDALLYRFCVACREEPAVPPEGREERLPVDAGSYG